MTVEWGSNAKTLGEWISEREKTWINSDLTREQVYSEADKRLMVPVGVADGKIAEIQKVADFWQEADEQDCKEKEMWANRSTERLNEIIELEAENKDLELRLQNANKILDEFTLSDIPNNRGNNLDLLSENTHDAIIAFLNERPSQNPLGVGWAKVVSETVWKWWEKQEERLRVALNPQNGGNKKRCQETAETKP